MGNFFYLLLIVIVNQIFSFNHTRVTNAKIRMALKQLLRIICAKMGFPHPENFRVNSGLCLQFLRIC